MYINRIQGIVALLIIICSQLDGFAQETPSKLFIHSLINEKTGDLDFMKATKNQLFYTIKNDSTGKIDTLFGVNELTNDSSYNDSILLDSAGDTIEVSKKNIINYEDYQVIDTSSIRQDFSANEITFTKSAKSKDSTTQTTEATSNLNTPYPADHPFAVLFNYNRAVFAAPAQTIDPTLSIQDLKSKIIEETKKLRKYSSTEAHLMQSHQSIKNGPNFMILLLQQNEPLEMIIRNHLQLEVKAFKEVKDEARYSYICCTNKDIATTKRDLDSLPEIQMYAKRRIIAVLGNNVMNLDPMSNMESIELFNLEMNKVVVQSETQIIKNKKEYLYSKFLILNYERRIHALNKENSQESNQQNIVKLEAFNHKIRLIEAKMNDVDKALEYLENASTQMHIIQSEKTDSLKNVIELKQEEPHNEKLDTLSNSTIEEENEITKDETAPVLKESEIKEETTTDKKKSKEKKEKPQNDKEKNKTKEKGKKKKKE